MNHDGAIQLVASEIAYELCLWPYAPSKLLHIGSQATCEILRPLFSYADLTFIGAELSKDGREQAFWQNYFWGRDHELILCLDFLKHRPSARSSAAR